MGKDDQNNAVPSYSRVIDNSQDYVAPAAPKQEGQQSPAPASGKDTPPADTPPADTPPADTPPAAAAPEGKKPVDQGAPGYIQDIQAQLAAPAVGFGATART